MILIVVVTTDFWSLGHCCHHCTTNSGVFLFGSHFLVTCTHRKNISSRVCSCVLCCIDSDQEE